MNANMAERIKTAREEQGLTQEQLAERLEISRQAVSKWEMGLSVPSPENLQLLEEVLKISLPQEEEDPPEQRKNPWKAAALILAALSALLAVLAGFVLCASHVDPPASDAGPPVPQISGVYFFDQAGQPLSPDQGDGWNQLSDEEPALLLVRFQDYGGGVNAAAPYFTPSGTETLDQRRQLALQAAGEGRDFALFSLELPQDAMGHLDVVLECGGGVSVTETLNVSAAQP